MQTYLGILKNTNSATKTLDDLGTVNLLQNLRRKLNLITNGQSAFQTFVGISTAATIVSGIVGITLFSIGAALDNNPLKLAGVIFLGLAAAVATIVAPLLTLRTYIREVAVATQVTQGGRGQGAGRQPEIVGLTKVAAVVGLVIGVAIPWGVFIYQALSGDVRVGTTAFNTAMAYVIANTIVTIVMFALSLTVVGFILTAVLGFVDLLLTGLCGRRFRRLFQPGGDDHRALASVIYSSGTTIDFNHVDANGAQDLVKLGVFDQPVQPQQRLHARQPDQPLGPGANGPLQPRAGGGSIVKYDSFFSASRLRSSTVTYSLAGDGASAPPATRRDDQRLAECAGVLYQTLPHLVRHLARQQHHRLPHGQRRADRRQPVADPDQGDEPADPALPLHGLCDARLRVLGRLLLGHHAARRHQDLPGRQLLLRRLPGHAG
ncbi:MAG: hypothetical protein HZY76_03445 [Anaerolineae bacterium]|nr:MAG: hypothetical protein HZY76_03445 [Anaerolineae bacterium]